MPTNNFLPFGTSGGAAVLSQTAYAAITPANGFGAGLLPKESLNKALRQANAMSSAMGAFLGAQGQDALDDGNIAALAVNIADAISARIGAGVAESTPAVITVGGATDAVGTISMSGWRNDISGKRQWVVTQAYDDAGTTVCTWTFPNATLFATGVKKVRCCNAGAMAGQPGAAHGGVISLLTQSATGITFYGHSTNVSGTKFWVLIEVEGY